MTFVPTVSSHEEERDDEDDDDDDDDGSPKLSFEMKSSSSREKGFKKLATKDEGRMALVVRDAPPPKRAGCFRKRGPSFVLATLKSYKGLLFAAFLFKVAQDLLTFASPQLLK